MARALNKLSATGIKAISTKGRYGDGGGLYLRVSPTLAKNWVFRWIRYGVAREIGFGSYPAVSHADARKAAFKARCDLESGMDPKAEKDKARETLRTFEIVATEYLEEMAGRWSNEKTRWQWQNTLIKSASRLARVPVREIDTAHVLTVLKPIWSKTPETAAKTRMRLEAILDYAKAKGWREGENPARWKGHLSNILPARQRLSRGHHPAMPYADVPAFFERLALSEAMAAPPLRFLILTAARTGEVLGATWGEIDEERAVWTIPAARMKAKRDHRVPLTETAMAVLRAMREGRRSDFVFPGMKPKCPLSNVVMETLLRRMGITEATPHGFRSSFRDWAGDCTSFPREIAEQALAHKTGDDTEMAYRRGDALEKRRRLMEAWAIHCEGVSPDNVVMMETASAIS